MFLVRRFYKSPVQDDSLSIGEIIYSNDVKSSLIIPGKNLAQQYQIQIKTPTHFDGISIPSHRTVYSYQNIAHIPTQKRSKSEAFNLTRNAIINNHRGAGGGQKGNYLIKETLLSWAISAEGNRFIEPDLELQKYFLDFQEILRKVLPKSLEFKEISIRNYEIIFVTNSGDFIIDAVSGGVSAIIDLAWQIFTYSNKDNTRLTVLIDEIENHLHPNLQRSILPNLLNAFPNIQFIVSTQSPLIVGSVKDSNVYAFRHIKLDSTNIRVVNERLDLVNKAKSATEILNEVLGVPFTLPLWVEKELDEIIEKYSKGVINENIFDQMRIDLEKIGLEEMMPIAMKNILKNVKNQ